MGSRVARWYILKPKIPFWVIFGRSCNVRYLYILWTFDIFYAQLVNIIALCLFCGHLVYFSRFGMLYQEKYGNPDGYSTKVNG
jgi:hypothetical protein